VISNSRATEEQHLPLSKDLSMSIQNIVSAQQKLTPFIIRVLYKAIGRLSIYTPHWSMQKHLYNYCSPCRTYFFGGTNTSAMFGWYMLVLVVVFNI
jgi:hypothetical protein